MKKLLLVLVLWCWQMPAQEASVEKSIWNIQTGTLGIWLNNESRLSNSVALRTEAGLDAGIFLGGIYDQFDFFMQPVIALEPRWYYNLKKRTEKSKNIAGNSANFVSLKTSYHPDWFIVGGRDNLDIISRVQVVPTWGIRRKIGSHFNYETGLGIGYRYIFGKSAGYESDEQEVAVNLHLRIGYQF